MTATLPTAVVTQPGVYDLPDDAYHRDPAPGGSLSASGAKKLLPPSCPAIFDYERRNPPKPKPVFDLGHGAHKLVLGSGPDLVRVDFPDWKTKKAQELRKEAHTAGKVPLLAHELDTVTAMAEALRRHPVASALFDPRRGSPEQSLFWTDAESGVNCRARLDWMKPGGRRLIVADYKTAVSAAPSDLGRTVHNFKYHMQAAFYLDGVKALGLHDAPQFVFVFQAKTPPYLVTVIQLDEAAERIGRELVREAIGIYRRCTDAGEWPGYSSDIEEIALPAWAERAHDSL